eukprot:GGOE01022793.1.p5 GENE.GGOE01022793.1~~GGOE01022793.1.p5  ORF type:complete len:101 (-),score=0.80 GGOE01022793.1:33-335(-)
MPGRCPFLQGQIVVCTISLCVVHHSLWGRLPRDGPQSLAKPCACFRGPPVSAAWSLQLIGAQATCIFGSVGGRHCCSPLQPIKRTFALVCQHPAAEQRLL